MNEQIHQTSPVPPAPRYPSLSEDFNPRRTRPEIPLIANPQRPDDRSFATLYIRIVVVVLTAMACAAVMSGP